MAKIKFLLQSKSENSQIYIRVSISQFVSIKKKTGFSINAKDWSVITDRPKQNNPENKITHSSLNKLENFVFDNLNKDLAKGSLIDAYWLENQINNCFKRVVKTDAGLLVNHIQYIIDNANTRKVKTNGGFKIGLSSSTIKNYTLFKNIILEYQTTIKKQIQFIEITKPFVEKFTNWLVNTKNYSTNYAGKQLEILKTVCIDAEKNEIPVTPYSKTIQHFRESENDRYIQTLSFEELEQIKNADFTDAEQLKEFKKANLELCKNISLTPETINNSRNWILLGCEIGQRGGDLLKITNENIRYKGKSIYLDILQQKTNKSVTVGLIAPHVIDIIENSLPKEMPHQKLNDFIKIVCKLAGIDAVVKGTKLNTETNRKELGMYPKYDLMASHCFRRSFATNYYKKIPTPILINITGHSKESLFLTYINKREDKDANADLFMQFYEDLNKEKTPQLKVIKNGTDN
ncbi:integrase [Flavobacterium psychrophilum FPG101]|uniref:phage integrase SAM-like domain-containing protein n=1 Tax=Flavobacterium psychrophilum TaxID=96345 RepID=UPI0004F753D0|nr:phage integrase SAM-like domain-containing protein [Flavobacterium psychrophilum]AIN70674.1 integrase [Flavobacterium psychrophilum FPG101]EKT3974852.1 phage integrase SAM-like domain-containing protein [Flavobacterium psychrophilum]EKT4537531.1 phage integrase SAM-like domain-containing protein [Flavobacterium psychrophilum]EKT4571709.1 phage integrase SAM-like domain-containing protein [Flavobacterium psychrophilum]KUM18986.1 integrase [Flavobacterium psychrophilum]